MAPNTFLVLVTQRKPMVVEPFGQILNNWLFQGELWWTFVFEEVSWSEHCHPVFGQKIMGFHYNHLSPPLAVLMERNHSRYSRYSASLIGAYTCKGKPSKLILSFIISGRNTVLLRFTQINRFHGDLALLELPAPCDALPVVLWGTEEEPAIGDAWI